MAKLTISVAIVLVALGLGSYLGTGRESMTALIPAFFGVAFLGLGLLALKDGLRKHAMHGAAALALVGFVAPSMRMFKAVTAEDGFTFSIAFGVQLAMAVICLLFVVACVRSFIAARRTAA